MHTIHAARTPAPSHASTTTPRRADLYAAIHKALRRAMTDTLTRLGALDTEDPADLLRTLAQAEHLLDMLRSHLQHENDFIHTAIEARRPAGARRTADDHLEHQGSIAALQAELRTLRAAEPSMRPTLALRLYRHFALFVAENLQHMHIEETANNAALWALYDDEELHALHDRLVASIPPAEMMDTLRWMGPALSPQELAALLTDMQAKAPPAAFAAVMDLLRPLLDPGRWVQLTTALGLQAGQPARAAGVRA
ncbi:hypothetical protein MW290_26435 [Aquincola tertiaricarbonis]|uniref:Hemerythrin-like domain-containing protein n=1 Tax=Aquincola tertiaricarbonis TaxID=391953 RepID=A0ABY4SBI8_AQUTE|nr:hypothetical protein [Aquincola tertiaricarbonis]URI09108.1 hypothetical protein MW290_26435 [Aquincola tertiaricarbonis]